ncbi:hypothetical protein PAXRUDRAFT_833643 [Paxillus rubicundulus Ve08.2h10]|uniref:Uncharacterized protein n=1 Tax=Paxillus rubicundulus Ve08.2h10 TaxID=930991 RepID=A0A0D0CBN9_9AGAM|nr:hypothetical protein PAXRUDRAFT_833643 [Paxillus rubicundulus Ve08.2h10]
MPADSAKLCKAGSGRLRIFRISQGCVSWCGPGILDIGRTELFQVPTMQIQVPLVHHLALMSPPTLREVC